VHVRPPFGADPDAQCYRLVDVRLTERRERVALVAHERHQAADAVHIAGPHQTRQHLVVELLRDAVELHPAFAVIEDKESAALVFELQGEAKLAGPLRMELDAERRIAVGTRAPHLSAPGGITAKHRQAALT